MPTYIFSNPSNENDIVEISMSMKEDHIFIKDGVKWNRVFTKPTAAVDTVLDPFDHKKNIQKISNTKGSLGDMQDFSREQSSRREYKAGQDPVKQKFFNDYASKRNGKRHPEERIAKLKEISKNAMIKFNSKLK